MSRVTTDQKLATFLRMHEAAFEYLGGAPEEVLYDWTKTAALGLDERGEVEWQSTFYDFAGYYGFTPRVCRAYRPQTKGKVENGIGYVRKNFLLAQYGQEPTSIEDLRGRLRAWTTAWSGLRLTFSPVSCILIAGDSAGCGACRGRSRYRVRSPYKSRAPPAAVGWSGWTRVRKS